MLLYVTAPTIDDARAIAASLVEQRLAACANIFPNVQSVYRWEGSVTCDEECVLIAKTTTDTATAARNCIIEHHPYDTPCVVAIRPDDSHSHAPFLDWIAAETTR